MNKRLVEIRKFKGLTQIEFAEKLGFTQANLSSIELGKTPLTEANINLICLTFGIRREWLKEGTGDMMDDESLLSDMERQLLDLFRKLSPRARIMLIEYAEKLIADEEALRSGSEAGEKGENPIHGKKRG